MSSSQITGPQPFEPELNLLGVSEFPRSFLNFCDKDRIELSELEGRLTEIGIRDNSVVTSALNIVQRECQGRFRKNGQPELEGHVYAVCLLALDYCLARGLSVSAQDVAVWLLHDSVEDCKGSKKALMDDIRFKCGEDVLAGVMDLTIKDFRYFEGQGRQEKRLAAREDLMNRIVAAGPKRIIPKLSDIFCNNTDIEHVTNPDRRQKLLDKFHKFYEGFLAKYSTHVSQAVFSFCYKEGLRLPEEQGRGERSAAV